MVAVGGGERDPMEEPRPALRVLESRLRRPDDTGSIRVADGDGGTTVSPFSWITVERRLEEEDCGLKSTQT